MRRDGKPDGSVNDARSETEPTIEAGLLRRLLGATGVFAAGILLSRCLGMVREMLVAARFGAGTAMDCFSVAQNIPFRMGTAVQVLATGATIPVMSRCLQRGEAEDARRVGGTVLAFVAVTSLALVLVSLAFARPVAMSLAPDFEASATDLTAELLRILAPYFFFAGVGGVLSCILLARQRFVVPALAHVLPNIAIIAVLVALASRLGVRSLAAGVTLGGLAYAAGLMPAAVRGCRDGRLLAWAPQHAGVRRAAVLAVPLLVPAFGAPLVGSIERSLLSGQAEGSIASLSYAENLISIPLGFLLSSLGTVLLPILSWDAASVDRSQLARRTSIAVRLVLMMMALVAALLMGLGKLPVMALYGAGEFDARAVGATAGVVAWLSPVTMGAGLTEVLTKAYHAVQDTTTPVMVWVVVAGLRVAGSVLAVHPMGVRGVAMARCIGAVLQPVLLATRLGRVVGRSIWPESLRVAATTVAAGALVAAVLAWVGWQFPLAYEHGRAAAALRLMILVLAATVAYTGMVLAANPRERSAILARARRRVVRQPDETQPPPAP
jgi:putative peptidoglycan lipid II flippase